MKLEDFRLMRSTLVVLAVAVAFGCAREATPVADKGTAPSTEAAPAQPQMPPGHPATGAPAGVPGLTGAVLETMDSGGYTYLKLKTAEGEVWAAVNESKVAKGDTVTVAGVMPMDGFESQTLNRKFDKIYFGTLAGGPAGAPMGMGGAAPAAMGGAAVPESMAAQHAQAATGPEVTEKISVAKAEGADGRTIAEVFAQRAALKGKTVAIRGKVVKFNSAIMGKNWIHLRDGSGTPETKDHDVTVTTNDTVAKGDVVVVRGTVAVDRDFGSGYTYVLVVEDAKVTK